MGYKIAWVIYTRKGSSSHSIPLHWEPSNLHLHTIGCAGGTISYAGGSGGCTGSKTGGAWGASGLPSAMFNYIMDCMTMYLFLILTLI